MLLKYFYIQPNDRVNVSGVTSNFCFAWPDSLILTVLFLKSPLLCNDWFLLTTSSVSDLSECVTFTTRSPVFLSTLLTYLPSYSYCSLTYRYCFMFDIILYTSIKLAGWRRPTPTLFTASPNASIISCTRYLLQPFKQLLPNSQNQLLIDRSFKTR